MGYESQGSAVMTREENRRPDHLGTWEPGWEICESFKGQWEPGKGQKKEVLRSDLWLLEDYSGFPLENKLEHDKTGQREQ